MLDKTSDENLIKKQDQTTILIRISQNSVGKSLTLDYIFQKWNELLVRFNSIPFTLNDLVLECLNGLNSKYDLDKIESFIQNGNVDLGMTMDSFKQVIEEINTNIRWLNKNFDLVTYWLVKTK